MHVRAQVDRAGGESITNATKGQTIKIVLKEILTAKELTSLTKLVDKMTNNFLSEKTSMSFLMWTLRCTCIALGPLFSLFFYFCMCGPPVGAIMVCFHIM